MPENDPAPPTGPDTFRLPCVLVPEGAARPLDAIAGLSVPVRIPVRQLYRAATAEAAETPDPWTGSRMRRSEGTAGFGRARPWPNGVGDAAQTGEHARTPDFSTAAGGTAVPEGGALRRPDRPAQLARPDLESDAGTKAETDQAPSRSPADAAGSTLRAYYADLRSLRDTKGDYIGVNQECVALVRELTRAPRSTTWRSGAAARGNRALRPGTAIATFDSDGHYGGHTVIYLGQDATGIFAYDQWRGHAPSARHIAFGRVKARRSMTAINTGW